MFEMVTRPGTLGFKASTSEPIDNNASRIVITEWARSSYKECKSSHRLVSRHDWRLQGASLLFCRINLKI